MKAATKKVAATKKSTKTNSQLIPNRVLGRYTQSSAKGKIALRLAKAGKLTLSEATKIARKKEATTLRILHRIAGRGEAMNAWKLASTDDNKTWTMKLTRKLPLVTPKAA